MAKVHRENIELLHDKIIVKVAKEDYMPAFERSMKLQAKTANVHGFRKGKAPMGAVKKMYGPEIFFDEIVRSAGRHLEDYIKATKLSVLTQPMLIPDEFPDDLDMNNPVEVSFAFEVGLEPEFDIHPLKYKPSLNRYKITVTDKMTDDEIERLRQSHGSAEEQESVTVKENTIYATYEPCDEEGNVSEEGDKKEGKEELGEMPLRLQEMIMGKKPEDTVIFRPADVCTEDELHRFLEYPLAAGEEAAEQYYKLTITKAELLKPMEAGPELYEKVFRNAKINDEARFREIIKSELSYEYDQLAHQQMHRDIYELLIHNTNVNLPAAFLKRWLIKKNKGKKTEEEVNTEFSTLEHNLRWNLIFEKLTREYRINISETEMENDLKTRVLSYLGFGPGDEGKFPGMNAYMEVMLKDEKMVRETYRRLREEKLFTALERLFTIEQKEISQGEFSKLGNAHDHQHHHQDKTDQ